MDGSSFPQTFPWELTNTDYFRRVLAQVGYALQPLVEATLRKHDPTAGVTPGVVVVGALGKDLKTVVEAVRKEYAPVLVVVGAQEKLQKDLAQEKWCTQDVYFLSGGGKLTQGDKKAVRDAHTHGKIVFLVEPAKATWAAAPGPAPAPAPAPAVAPPAPPATNFVVAAQGEKLKALAQAAGSNWGKLVFQSQHPQGKIGCDAYTLMKHIKHDKHIALYAKLLGCTIPTTGPDPKLKTALYELMNGRNKLAHMTLTSDTDWLTYDKMKSIFADALFVVERVGEYLKTEKGLTDNYAAANMERLEKQWQMHTASKYQRQNARPAIDSWQLFVGNLPDETTKQDLVGHLNEKMYDAGLCTAPGHPVISCNISKGSNEAPDYAFIKLRSVQETNNCLSLNGLKFNKSELKIGRPKNDNKLYMALLARGLEDAAVALGASLADDAARQGVSSQLRRSMPSSEGVDPSKLVELRTLKGHSNTVRCGVRCLLC